jgi:hypothetical protein
MPNQQYNQLHNMYRTYIADNFWLTLVYSCP